MSHYSYLDEIGKKTRRQQLLWLFLMTIISMVIIALLVIIKKETEFFVDVQEVKSGLSRADRLDIEKKLVAGYAKRDLGLNDKMDIEKQVLGVEVEAESHTLLPEERLDIENRLK